MFPAFSGGISPYWTTFVAFGEYQPERHAVFAEHPDKIEVDLLRIEPGIDQHEQENHRLPFLHVIGNQLRELPALVFRNARIAVSGQIDQIPLRIDFKMIDQPGFTGSRGNFSDDLPTFERPISANSGKPSVGHWLNFWLLTVKTAEEMCIRTDFLQR